MFSTDASTDTTQRIVNIDVSDGDGIADVLAMSASTGRRLLSKRALAASSS